MGLSHTSTALIYMCLKHLCSTAYKQNRAERVLVVVVGVSIDRVAFVFRAKGSLDSEDERQHAASKRRELYIRRDGITCQKNWLFSNTAVR